MVFFGETALRRAVDEFVTHYNQEPNQQVWPTSSSAPRYPLFLSEEISADGNDLEDFSITIFGRLLHERIRIFGQ
jgi:hypothetical protein